MATIRCPKCGANQEKGTHCAICGQLLNASPQQASTQYKDPAKPEADFGLFSQNTEENPLTSAQAPTGVVVKEKHSVMLIVILLMVCLGISVALSLILNQKPDAPQIPETVQPVAVVPPPPPQPEAEPPTPVYRTDFNTEKNDLDTQSIRDNGRAMIYEVLSNHYDLIFSEKDTKNTAYIQSSIEDIVVNKECNTNAEDIIIAMEGDIKNLQKVLRKVNYRKFYTKLLYKHLESNKCKYTDSSADVSWDERESTALLTNSKKHSVPNRTMTTCANENLSPRDNILNVSLEINILTEPNRLPALHEIALGWGAPYDKYYRYYDDFVIDPYILVDSLYVDPFDSVKIRDYGRIVLYNSDRDMRQFIRSEADFAIVYGRFIPDTSTNMSYFVLSYRKYDLKHTYGCTDFEAYKKRVFPELKETRPKDSQIDLPF